MKKIEHEFFTGERPLYHSSDLIISHTIFGEGESPLKESRQIQLDNTLFQWKYPLWYCQDIEVENCTWFEMARAGVWYTKNISVKNSAINAPKNFRRCSGLKIENCTIPDAKETLWNCTDVVLKNVSASGDYFGMNSSQMEVDNLQLYGNYSFDGVKDMVIRNSRLVSKDAFWNCENIVVENCQVYGEYIGWNSKNLTFKNCVIESLQGLCYIENLKLIDCILLNTTLAFERSDVNVSIQGTVQSIFNPEKGIIEADGIGEIILDEEYVNPKNTEIRIRG